MPSFLNKVFGYKKTDDKEAARPTRELSDSTLLDGKYEAISPISPSASVFPDVQPTKDSERDVGFSLFKAKSRGAHQKPFQKQQEATPLLTLQLPGPKEAPDSRALGVVFEADPDAQMVLDDAVITAKRLNPLEALILIKACAQTITERGLETLGIMHPHWFSASPNVQRKLISLFIRSLTPQDRITTLSPTRTSPASAFENELHYTRSPHDVAAVLRWGLRHLSLGNGQFGKDGAEWAWYDAFFNAERSASYPPNAFSELLLPQLPASHTELLTVTLTLVSSLACHAESNSISGSKLSKFLGIWLLVATRAEQSDDWNRFYARWERAGRILEHLFLARLREESLGQRLPTRLQELVKYYPYNKDSLAREDGLLSRPRISTRQYDALFVRVETLLMHNSEQPKQHPIQLLLEAFQLPIENPLENEHVTFWNTLKTATAEGATSPDAEGLQLTRIFVDDTIQLLSLISADSNALTSSTPLTTPITKAVSRKHSSSPTKFPERSAPRSITNDGSTPASPTSPSSSAITDWAQFSLSGFGDTPTTKPLAALLCRDDDVEVTQPRSRQRGKSRTRRRRSEDHEPPDTTPSSQLKQELSVIETKLSSVHVIQIDEAFIDFWSDAIVDPISADWPTFVVCGLKQIPGVELPIHWLVIEQTYIRQQPQSSRVPSPDGQRGRSPRPSFKSDISGFRINSMFSSARKRFSAFSKSATDLTRKSGGKTPVAGELGEILVEEEPTSPSIPATKADHHFDGNAAVTTAVTSGATTNIADQLRVDEITTVPIAGIPPRDLVSVSKEGFDSALVVAKPSSIEPTPQSGGTDNSFSVPPHPPVKPSEEAFSVERGSPRILDIVNSDVSATDPDGRITPLATATSDLRSMQNMRDLMAPASGSAPLGEQPVTEEVQVRADQVRRGVAVGSTDRLANSVAQLAGAEFTGELSNVAQLGDAGGSRKVTEAIVVSLASETIAVELARPVVDDEAPGHAAKEPCAVEQPSQNAPIEFAAAPAVESLGQHVMDNFPPVTVPDVQDKEIAIEVGAQPEPDLIASMVDSTEESTEVSELVGTPAPEEFVALVEETPGRPEVSVDAHERAVEPAIELDTSDDVAPQPVAAELKTVSEADKEPAARGVDPPVETIPVVSPSAQVVASETEHTADRALELTTKAVQPLIQDTVVQAAEAPLVAEVEAYVSAVPDVALVEAESRAVSESSISEVTIVRTHSTTVPTPAPENAVLVDEMLGPYVAAEAHGLVEAAPALAPEPDAVEDKAPKHLLGATEEARALLVDSISLDDEVQPSVETEPPTQFINAQPAEAQSTEVIQYDTTPALATAGEVITSRAETQRAPDVSLEDVEGRTFATEGAPIENTLDAGAEANGSPQTALGTAADPDPVVHEATEPGTKEAQVPTVTVLSAGEPVAIAPTAVIGEPAAQDVQPPIEIEGPSGKFAPQFVGGAANSLIVGGHVLEENSSSYGEGEPEFEALYPTVDTADAAQEARAIVDADELGALASEPELTKIGTPAPVEQVQAPAEEEAPSLAAAKVTEEVVSSEPEGKFRVTNTTQEEPNDVSAAALAVEAGETGGGANGPQEAILPC